MIVGLLLLLCLAAPAAGVAAAPQAHTEAASSVSYSSAVLNGSVSNEGQGGAYFFQYGPTSKFGLQTPLQPLAPSTSKVHISQAITGLQAFTTYHYRLVVTGAAAANTVAFTTPKIPLSVAIVAVPNPVTYGSSFTVEGTLSGTGGATARWRFSTPPSHTRPPSPSPATRSSRTSPADSCSPGWRPQRTRSCGSPPSA